MLSLGTDSRPTCCHMPLNRQAQNTFRGRQLRINRVNGGGKTIFGQRRVHPNFHPPYGTQSTRMKTRLRRALLVYGYRWQYEEFDG